MTSFEHLGLSNPVLKAISELGFETPSEIQEQAIPQLLQEKQDFIGLAQTGTGKTAAFGLPLLDNLDEDLKHTQALILAPTRELGQQIAEQLALFSKYLNNIYTLPVYGGANIVQQIKALKKTQHVIIATPGRLIDLIKRKAVNLDAIRYLILDEADEMLNMGFKEDLDIILNYTPEDKSTWLFSATMSKEIRRIVNQYMTNPLEIKVDAKNKVNTNIEHMFAVVSANHKTEALTRFLDVNPDMRGVVFCRTRQDTQNLTDTLLKKNYKADALHGDLSQAQRDRVMKRFKNHALQVLIATDVAARGIDVNDLTHVFHFSLPDDVAYYTHRSGRTARAGKKGISLAFVSHKDKSKIDRFSRSLGISFQKVLIPTVNDIYESRMENWCQAIVEKENNGTIKDELTEKANFFFESLSKEDLIQKLLVHELEKIKLESTQNLNEAPPKRSRDRNEGRKDKRNFSGRSRSSRSRKRKFYKKKKD